jgi:hypothetical protein
MVRRRRRTVIPKFVVTGTGFLAFTAPVSAELSVRSWNSQEKPVNQFDPLSTSNISSWSTKPLHRTAPVRNIDPRSWAAVTACVYVSLPLANKMAPDHLLSLRPHVVQQTVKWKLRSMFYTYITISMFYAYIKKQLAEFIILIGVTCLSCAFFAN